MNMTRVVEVMLWPEQDIAFSYGAGALGGFLYLRALNRSVDSLGQFSVGSLASNQRLLIPVILALGYNRSAPLIFSSFVMNVFLMVLV